MSSKRREHSKTWVLVHDSEKVEILAPSQVQQGKHIVLRKLKDERDNNVFAFQHKGGIYYRTLRAIEVGEELYVWYGANYWAKRATKERKRTNKNTNNKTSAPKHDSQNGFVAAKPWVLVKNLESLIFQIIKRNDVKNGKHIIIEELEDEQVAKLGHEVSEEEFDPDLHIYCHLCDKEYSRYCRLHPLRFIANRDPRSNNDPNLSHPQKSVPEMLRFDESKTPERGDGVFPNEKLVVGNVFGPYAGNKVHRVRDFKRDGSAWQLRNTTVRTYIDGSDDNSANWMRFIHHAPREQLQNLWAFQYDGNIYYRVIKPIAVGQEMLVWSGEEYDKKTKLERKRDQEKKTEKEKNKKKRN